MARGWSLQQCLCLLKQLCGPESQLAQFDEEVERTKQLQLHLFDLLRDVHRSQQHMTTIIQRGVVQQLAAAFGRGLQLLVAELRDRDLEQLPDGCRQAPVALLHLGDTLVGCSESCSGGYDINQLPAEFCTGIASSGARASARCHRQWCMGQRHAVF